MVGLPQGLKITDPERLYDFYCWAIWNLEPEAWITCYEPCAEDWREYAEFSIDNGLDLSYGFYQWASEFTETYQPRQEHLERYIRLSN